MIRPTRLTIEVDAVGDDTCDDEAVSRDFASAATTLTHDGTGEDAVREGFPAAWPRDRGFSHRQGREPAGTSHGRS
jgi:hypothetical protein